MRILAVPLLAIACLGCPQAATGSAFVRAECRPDGVSFDVTVEYINQWVEGDPTGYELVVEMGWVGACAEPVVVDSPSMPLGPFMVGEPVESSFVLPAEARDQVFLLRPALRRPDGTIQSIPQSYGVPAYDFAVCGRSIAARGYLRYSWGSGEVWLEPCADDCGTWICYATYDVSALDPEDFMPYVDTGTVVEVEGTPTADGMLHVHCLEVTSIAPAPPGVCGVVSGRPESWGGLKATYR